jgi:hypothetical protein
LIVAILLVVAPLITLLGVSRLLPPWEESTAPSSSPVHAGAR